MSQHEIKYLDKQGLAHLWEKFKEQNLVFSNTVEGWNSQPSLISKKGAIQIYTNYSQNEEGKNIPAFKVGDGLAYLIDLPISDEKFWEHINDTEIHITQEEREFWNNKVRNYVDPSDPENLIYTIF